MPIGSIEGLLLTLLFVVPGGLGYALRKSIYSAQPPSAFLEAVNSLAAALVALLGVEVVLMVVHRSAKGVGDYLLSPIARLDEFDPSALSWRAYAAFCAAAVFLPTIGAWSRRTDAARWMLRAVSPHADGLDYIVHEARPKTARKQEMWATVTTTSGESLLGQVAWRATAPDPLEVVLSRARDLNDPSETEQEEDWMVWLPRDSIEQIWIHVPRAIEDVSNDVT